MKRILIFDSDEEEAAELKRAVEARGQHDVTVAPTLREACLVVTEFAQDLALVSWPEAENASQALLSLQPDLPIVALVPEGKAAALEPQTDGAYALLTMQELQEKLPDLLREESESTATETVAEEEGSSLASTVLDAMSSVSLPERRLPELDEALEAAARQEKVVAVLLTAENELLKHKGSLDEHQVPLIASRIGETWRPKNSALIQFLRLPSRTSDLMLFTRPVDAEHLITLVALPDMSLGQAREIMEDLFRRAPIEAGGTSRRAAHEPIVTTRVVRPAPDGGESYALVWQPRRPLPATLRDALREALERIAAANACTLRHVMVKAELIHIVVSCPDGRSTARIATLFKQGTEAEIQDKFGVPARLWNKGYYATHSEEPLSQAELNLFLNDVGARA